MAKKPKPETPDQETKEPEMAVEGFEPEEVNPVVALGGDVIRLSGETEALRTELDELKARLDNVAHLMLQNYGKVI